MLRHGQQELFRVVNAVVFGDHAPRDGEDAAEEGEVEEDGAGGGDFEVDEEVGVEHGGEEEDGGEGACDEGDEAREGCVSIAADEDGREMYRMMMAIFSLGN